MTLPTLTMPAKGGHLTLTDNESTNGCELALVGAGQATVLGPRGEFVSTSSIHLDADELHTLATDVIEQWYGGAVLSHDQLTGVVSSPINELRAKINAVLEANWKRCLEDETDRAFVVDALMKAVSVIPGS